MSTNSVASRTSSVHFPPENIDEILLSIFQLIPDFINRTFREKVRYNIESEVESPATKVIFTRSKRTHERICLKVWLRWNDELYDTRDITACTAYLVDGLNFNRRFAQHVYLGIAPVELSDGIVWRGKLIADPKKRLLENGVEYALVMKYLKNERQLCCLLQEGKLNKEVDMVFLAQEVAQIHKQLDRSPENIGNYKNLFSKLELNTRFFLEALNHLSPNDAEKYRGVDAVMARACQIYRRDFEQRYESGHIRRCHGDLKATNLWVCPAKKSLFFLKGSHKALVALDCVDFNHPEFCHIDTLSDVAMLAIDLEMRLGIAMNMSINNPGSQELVLSFLETYLAEMKENLMEIGPLLAYYMTEKAMVCAYMSILYDNRPDLGRNYLDVMLMNAQKLMAYSYRKNQDESNEELANVPFPCLLRQSTARLADGEQELVEIGSRSNPGTSSASSNP